MTYNDKTMKSEAVEKMRFQSTIENSKSCLQTSHKSFHKVAEADINDRAISPCPIVKASSVESAKGISTKLIYYSCQNS